MVKYKALLSFVALMIPTMCLAEGLSARVDKNKIGVNETLNLQVELSDSQPTAEPDFSELEKTFRILSRQQSTSQNVINGTTSFATTWSLTLTPNEAGQTLIPSIAIETNQGEFKSQPIAVQVSQDSQSTTASSKTSPQQGISFVGTASKSSPYKNEGIKVTYRLNANRTLRNVQADNITVKDAIVEAQGQPKLQRRLVNGREQEELVLSFLVTPLKDGPLAIPPLVVHAETAAKTIRSSNGLGRLGSLFGDDEDGAMANMQKMLDNFAENSGAFEGFQDIQPITLASNSITLNVLPAVPGIQPWLPATGITLSEAWSGDQPRVGEPLTRTITIEALGVNLSQLPGFEEQFHSNEDYKVYSDRPLLTSPKGGELGKSLRQDTFTIIPEKEGKLFIPKIKLAWWDTIAHVQRVSSVPARSIQVLAGTQSARISNTSAAGVPSRATQTEVAQSQFGKKPSYELLMIPGFLTLLLVAAYFLTKGRKTDETIPIAKTTELKLPMTIGKVDLMNCANEAEIQQFLQNYSQANWGTLPNSSLKNIFSAAQLKTGDFDIASAHSLSKSLEDALYANRTMDFSELRDEFSKLVFKKLIRDSRTSNSPQRLPELNPS